MKHLRSLVAAICVIALAASMYPVVAFAKESSIADCEIGGISDVAVGASYERAVEDALALHYVYDAANHHALDFLFDYTFTVEGPDGESVMNGFDYWVGPEYAVDKNAAALAGEYTVTFVGSGSYAETSKTAKFEVRDGKRLKENGEINLSFDKAPLSADGIQSPEVTVFYRDGEGEKTQLTQGRDYQLTFMEQGEGIFPASFPVSAVGDYFALVIGVGDYVGALDGGFEVFDPLNLYYADVDYRKVVMTGDANMNPITSVTIGGLVVDSSEYSIHYSERIWSEQSGSYYLSGRGTDSAPEVPGEYEFEIVDKVGEETGSRYYVSGRRSFSYVVAADSYSGALDDPETTAVLVDGQAYVPVQDGADSRANRFQYEYSGAPAPIGISLTDSKTKVNLEKDIDYTVSYYFYPYADNEYNRQFIGADAPCDAGRYAAYVRASGSRYSGEFRVWFDILPTSIEVASVSGLKAEAYTGKSITPDFTLKIGSVVLHSGVDYTVSYTKNIVVGTARMLIEGKGNYSGTLEEHFSIVKAVQPMRVAVSSKVVKARKVRKKAQKVAGAIVVKSPQGVVSYARLAKGSSKRLSIDSKTGKITVKKKTKKGTYKIRVQVSARGNDGYLSGGQTVVAIVKVK